MTKILELSDKYCVRAAATHTGLNFGKFKITISRGSVELQWRLKNQNVPLIELHKIVKDCIQFAPRVQKLWPNSQIQPDALIHLTLLNAVHSIERRWADGDAAACECRRCNTP